MPSRVAFSTHVSSTIPTPPTATVYFFLLTFVDYLHQLLSHHIMAAALFYMLPRTESFREVSDDDGRSKSDSEDSVKSTDSTTDPDTPTEKSCPESGLSQGHQSSFDDDPEAQETLLTFKKDFNLQLNNEESSLNVDSDQNTDITPRYCSLPETFFRKNFSEDPSEHLCQLRAISPNHLGYQLTSGESDLLLLDCRSFMKYNHNHIKGALNACCTNNTIKKRFVNRRIEVVDLVSGVPNKDLFRQAVLKEGLMLVVYDEDTIDLLPSPPSDCLRLITSRLIHLPIQLRFLTGGMKEFLKSQAHHCSNPTSSTEPSKPLFSPTSPYVDAAIDFTTITQVLPFLYLGNEKDASEVDKLLQQDITHLLNVSASIPFYCQGTSIVTMRLPSSDNSHQNIKQYFAQAISFIEEAKQQGGRVLVHCQAGVSRSPTITMAFLMHSFSWSSYQAFDFVKLKRPIVAPNINFMGQLLEFESTRHQLTQ